jgi:microsomal dipeptidase-like Zn-dependent dipeptidase
VNALGLTHLGEVAINEMMKLGMIIDVDHMSERAMRRAIDIAWNVTGKYPLAMGHNGVRVAPDKERSAPSDLIQKISDLGGMFGMGTEDTTARKFISNYRSVLQYMGNRAVGIGSDVDGFARLPTHEKAPDQATSDAFYIKFLHDPAGLPTRQKTGNRTWDYVLDTGVAHYGLMPEFLFDVKTSEITPQGKEGAEVYDNLMQSVEHFAQMWQKCETVAKSVSSGP